jgi:hypothetical protein
MQKLHHATPCNTLADRSKDGALVIPTEWRGVALEIAHMTCSYAGIDHIEIMSAGRVPLPITETGYKSLFIDPEPVTHAGGAEGFVLAWLDHEATSAAWKRYEAEDRQLSLF